MSFKLQFFGFTFLPRLIPTLMTLVLLPLLISLGLWQLDRAEEKRQTDSEVNQAINKPALLLNNSELAKLENEVFRKAKLIGHYDINQQFLLDNRTHKGISGYHVLSPFLIENNAEAFAVLINRGWIAYQGTRDKISNIEIGENKTEILGTIKLFPRSIVLKDTKGENDTVTSSNFRTEKKQLEGVSLLQSIELERLEKSLNYKLLPVMIELDKTANNGFIREWQPYYGSIDKHNAYALQWFAMASILLFLFIKLNIRKS